MNEEELKQLQEQLKAKEEELKKKEEELKQREADADVIATNISKSYEERMNKQNEVYERRIKERDDVIRQLTSGDAAKPEEGPFAELNKRRLAQKAA